MPFFLILLFISNIIVVQKSIFFLYAFIMQCMFYLLSLFGRETEKKRGGAFRKIFFIPYYFCLGNLGILRGVINFLRGDKKTLWTPVRPG